MVLPLNKICSYNFNIQLFLRRFNSVWGEELDIRKTIVFSIFVILGIDQRSTIMLSI